MMLTREDFERAYAERSGVTLEGLHELGLFGIPCRCGDEICEGWQMASAEREPGPWEPEAREAWGREMERRRMLTALHSHREDPSHGYG